MHPIGRIESKIHASIAKPSRNFGVGIGRQELIEISVWKMLDDPVSLKPWLFRPFWYETCDPMYLHSMLTQ